MIDYLLSLPWYGLIFYIFSFLVIISGWLSMIEIEPVEYKENKKVLTIEKHNTFMNYLKETKTELNEAELNAYIKIIYNSNIFDKNKK
jgi:hypothetical protein